MKTYTEAQNKIQDEYFTIVDAAKKARSILQDLQKDYGYWTPEEAPGFENLDQYVDFVKSGKGFNGQKLIENFETWICHYKKIILRLDMMIDYLEIVDKSLEAAEAPIMDAAWTSGTGHADGIEAAS